MAPSKITWTKIDEAPALATYSLLPIVQAFTRGTGVELETRDISLAGRIIANFPENLTDAQKIPDDLSRSASSRKTPRRTSSSCPTSARRSRSSRPPSRSSRSKGYDIPDFPEEPKTDEERALRERFAVVLGSAVNPVLREGNSDRRACGRRSSASRRRTPTG
jgi:isocitrate dehydrogenase